MNASAHVKSVGSELEFAELMRRGEDDLRSVSVSDEQRSFSLRLPEVEQKQLHNREKI